MEPNEGPQGESNGWPSSTAQFDTDAVPSKLLVLDRNKPVPKIWGRGYELQEFRWGRRIRCSTDGDRVEFLRSLLDRYPGPFAITYVLEDKHRTSYREGRYRSPSLTRQQVDFFLEKFSDFIQNDGRHHIYVSCSTSGGAVIYDQHDFFFVYGSLDQHMLRLRSEGFRPTAYDLREHAHAIKGDSAALDELLRFWPWAYSPPEITDVTTSRIGILRFAWLKLKAWWHDRTRRVPD
jgi:hypothetical protein